ncbi:MAG TPA: DUF3089 domain-containing protein [Acidimicrobiales bacterium]|jgi:hypothetical protein|nr:DUF3089 domain-containing protein [Acidimicrobiales bacterium]
MRTAIGIARRGQSCLAVAGTLVAVACVALATLVPATGELAAAERPLQATSHTVWLCQPGHSSDPCAKSRTATSVTASGATSTFSTAKTAHAKKFDCFYVYPTVSKEASLNADLSIQPEETGIAQGQASQFSTVCNVWAPMYRQATQDALGDGEAFTPDVIATAYNSLLAAWKDYLAHDNHGRPVVFIGHSQGAAMLIKLLRTQVDPSPKLRKRLVSAIILGGNVQVPIGRDVGGSFRHIPTCASSSQTGCVIAYSSFPSEPGSDAVVGRPGQGVSIQSGQTATSGQQVACVNPVTFSSSVGNLVPMYPTVVHEVRSVTTPWIVFPTLYSAQCMRNGDAAWLQVDRLVAPPRDARPAVTNEGPMWGYHLDDMNLALGNLVFDVALEEASFR